MEYMVNFVSILLLLLNFRLLGGSRIFACINTLAVQAFLAGLLSLFSTHSDSLLFTFFLIVVVIVKSVAMPMFIKKAARETQIYREVEPFVGYSMSLINGVGMLCICFVITDFLPMAFLSNASRMFATVALFTIMTGLFLIVSRKKAITQVIGYLVLENGIFAFGCSFDLQEHFLIESGILLDVFAAVFIMGIMVCNIKQEFEHIDIHRLSKLKD